MSKVFVQCPQRSFNVQSSIFLGTNSVTKIWVYNKINKFSWIEFGHNGQWPMVMTPEELWWWQWPRNWIKLKLDCIVAAAAGHKRILQKSWFCSIEYIKITQSWKLVSRLGHGWYNHDTIIKLEKDFNGIQFRYKYFDIITRRHPVVSTSRLKVSKLFLRQCLNFFELRPQFRKVQSESKLLFP